MTHLMTTKKLICKYLDNLYIFLHVRVLVRCSIERATIYELRQRSNICTKNVVGDVSVKYVLMYSNLIY